MNNAQKGSVHRQFYQSPHRQRVISMAIPSGILVERIYCPPTNPIPADFSTLADYSVFTFTGGNNVGTKPFYPSPYSNQYSKFEIQTPDTTWKRTSSGELFNLASRPAGAAVDIYSGIGVGCSNVVFGWVSKMRIHFPARGIVGFYYGYGSNTFDISLQSSQVINHSSGSTEVFPPYPTKGPMGEDGYSAAVFFFGVENESEIPAEISTNSIFNLSGPVFEFP